MCNSEGGVIDDLYLYRLGDEEFFLIVNASRTNADWAWLEARKGQGHGVVAPFELTNDSGRAGAVAIQGPRVVQFIDELLPGTSVGGTHGLAVSQLKKNQIGLWHWNQHEIWAARTGYTGEDGFELVASAAALEPLWERAMSLGHVGCIQPCGLGARDTLRTEMGFPLYGHELDEQTTPLDAGLGAFVALDGRSFPGHDTLAQQKQAGTSKKLAAFRMTSKAPPPRPGYSIRSEGRQLGIVVSGTQSPSLQVGIGMGYVPPPFAEVGRKIEIEIRGKEFGAEIVKRPFYRREPGVVQSPVSRPATK
jgi:aminomethyltransferase